MEGTPLKKLEMVRDSMAFIKSNLIKWKKNAPEAVNGFEYKVKTNDKS